MPSTIERSSSRWRRAPKTSSPIASAAYPHPSTTYGPGATSSTSGAKRPTASAPAVAVSAVRHQASQVRSAAIDVRCQTSTCAAVGAGGSGSGSAMGATLHERGSAEQDAARVLGVQVLAHLGDPAVADHEDAAVGVVVVLAGRAAGAHGPLERDGVAVGEERGERELLRPGLEQRARGEEEVVDDR